MQWRVLLDMCRSNKTPLLYFHNMEKRDIHHGIGVNQDGPPKGYHGVDHTQLIAFARLRLLRA